MESLGALLPFVLILLAFYLLIIRPARGRQRAQTRLQGELAVGQRVMMTSGLYGEIAAIDDDAVVLETSPGVTQRWAKPAVARVLTEPDSAVGPDEAYDGAGAAGEPGAAGERAGSDDVADKRPE